MGSDDFRVPAAGRTARYAFEGARRQALYDHGHSGYSGTIAEKDEFILMTPPAGVDPTWDLIEAILGENYDKLDGVAETYAREMSGKVQDKWGPAGCMKTGVNQWAFFGWASS